MSISDNYSPDISTGNGATTIFTGNWSPLNSSYMRVYLELISTGVQTLQTLGVDYTLSFTDEGYTVTFTTAPSNLYRVIRSRSVTLEQQAAYSSSRGFQGADLEATLDKTVAMVQDMSDSVDRSVKVALGSSVTTDLPAASANKLLGWNSGATALENKTITDLSTAVISEFMETLLDDSTAADARTTLGLGTIATQAASGVAITGGSITGITDLAIADGGTGASTAAAAFTALKQAATDSATGVVEKATQAEMEAETADKYPDAALLKYSPGVAKIWAVFNGTGTPAVLAGYDVSSITDNGTGDYTINFSTTLSSANYGVAGAVSVGTLNAAETRGGVLSILTMSTTSLRVLTPQNSDNGATPANRDYDRVSLAIFGDI